MSGFFILIFLLIGMGVPVLVNTYNTDTMFENVVSKDNRISLNTQKLIKLIVDMETGQRGFIITGDEVFLEPYNNGVLEFDKTIVVLKDLLGDNVSQLDNLRTIQLSVEKWQTQAAIPEIEIGRKVASSSELRKELDEFIKKGQESNILADINSILGRIALNFGVVGHSKGSIATLKVKNDLQIIQSAQFGFLLNGEENFLNQYQKAKNNLSEHLNSLKINSTNSSSNKKLTNELDLLIRDWQSDVVEISISKRKEINKSPETHLDVSNILAQAHGKNILDGIRSKFDNFIAINDQIAKKHFISAKDSSASTIQIIWLIVLLAPIVALIIGLQLSNTLSTTLGNLIEASKKIALGEKNVRLEIESKDEIGNLAQQMNIMAASIQHSAEESDKQNWLKTTVSRGLNLSQGVTNINKLLNDTTTFFAKEIGVGLGAIYIAQKDTKEGASLGLSSNETNNGYFLALEGSYAFKKRKNISNKIKLGEGLVGQVAYERKTILLTDIPEDYIKINSGLGEHSPVNITAVPILFENILYGVIELASFKEFTSMQETVIEEVARGLGYSIHNIIGKRRTEQLLDMSQRKSEELEEQTERLKVSEEELRVQQEELAQTNAELEEKAQLLESVNDNVLEQNQTLKQAREVIRQKAEELEISSKYKSEFLSNMSHELRTPLNSILVLSKLLQDDTETGLNNEQLEFASIIHKSGSELLELINEVLDLAKIESGKIDINVEDLIVEDLIGSIKDTFSVIANEKTINFKVGLSEAVPSTIQSDSIRLKQVLKNLLSNAFKFTEEQGEIEFSIDLVPSRADFIEELLLKEEKVLKIAVRDTGIGIPKNKFAQIFEAFQQADGTTERKYGGTGLGLSITKELIKNLGGEVRLDSEVGVGSTFTVYLPVSLTKNNNKQLPLETDIELPMITKKPPTVNGDSEFGGKGKKYPNIIADDRDNYSKEDQLILIIEDDLTFAKILLDFSRKQGYKGIVVDQGDLALPYVEAYNPSAILLDIQLPKMNGWTILKNLKASSYAHIPVHVMSGNENRQLGMDLGALSYLVKPIANEQLEKVFSNLINQSERKGSILIVEDNESQNKAIRSLFKKHGLDTIPAFTAKEAKALLEKEDIITIVLDIGLPDNNDLEFLSYIKKEYENIPTVVFTGRDLSKEEIEMINELESTSIVLKGNQSGDRIIRETELFLQHIENRATNKPVLSELPNTLKGKKILIVDDDVRNIYTLKAVFKNQELEIVTATNGIEALEVMNTDDEVDLVLMDIMMPEMDGYQATRELRKIPKFEKLPILALTAKAMKGDREKCLEAGASDYITKPVDTEQLLSLMRVWLYEN